MTKVLSWQAVLFRGIEIDAEGPETVRTAEKRIKLRDVAVHLVNDLAALDGRAVFAFVYAAAGLTCIYYLRDASYPRILLANTRWAAIGEEAANATNNNLYGLIWWVFISVTFYFAVPALI